ncbi:MAG: FecR domain-containing protein [Opitutae bacterium]|nr:FecR domain-containing protein [Opitutae bacterium]
MASLKGNVRVINLFESNESDKNNAKPTTLKAGEIVLQGSTIVSGKNSEVDLLFTNGTSAKIGSNSKLTISAIWQKDFQESKRKVADINEETSPTRIDLDLNIGDLIVDVKKLKKESSFRVKSPLGVAGIRGTQFRIFSENEKVELSVLKGEVSFWDQKNEENKITNSEKLVIESDIEPILKPLNPKEKQTIQRKITSVKKSIETYDLSNLADKLGTKATRTQPVKEIKQTLEKIKEQNLKDKKKLNTEITSLKNELKKEKELIKKYKEAAETQITVLKNNIEQLEKQKQEIQKRHEAEIGGFMDNYNAKLQSIRREVIRADAAGYKRGIDEMLARQQGGFRKQ